jgi:hypothetical protein
MQNADLKMYNQKSIRQELPNHEMAIQDGTSPCTVVFKNVLYIFWNGSGKDGIWFTTYDGIVWKDQISLKQELPDQEMNTQDGTSPCAITFEDSLYVFWNGSGKDGIWFTTYDGTAWKNQESLKLKLPDQEMSIQDGTSPCAITFEDSLYVFWNGSGKDGIWFTNSHP